MPSLRKAINAYCRSCGYDSKSGLGSFRKQIEDCPCTSCHLYEVRPRIKPKQGVSELPQGISNYGRGAE